MYKIKCIYCNSENTRKSGHYSDGRQRYKCKDCHHVFSKDSKPKEKLNKTCPYCGSTRMKKAGHNKSGSQRYYCNDCKRKSCDKEVQIFFKDLNTDVECPYCHSHNLKKGGHLKSGAQRYICKDCDRYFSDKTRIKPDLGITCPHCGSTQIGTSGIDHGKQRYRCNNCKRRFITDYEDKKYNIVEKICPICGHTKARHAGKTGIGTRYYKCMQCNHKYREDPKFTHTTETEKVKIKELYRSGLTYEQMSSIMNKNIRTIRTIIKNYRETLSSNELANIQNKRNLYKGRALKKKQFPSLNDKQLKLMYQFGVILGIPAKEIAPYVPCSVKLCSTYINTFKNKKIVKPIRIKVKVTDKDRKRDWFELNQFISQ